ncbi:MAG: hypothetical protein IKV45_04615 [Firmicutes bacterium]|nr:hypothetical protein [Bacillota bacterium]
MSEKLHYNDFFPGAEAAPKEDEFAALFADIGMVDPYTGEPIRTKADFLRWKQRFMADTEYHQRHYQRAVLPDPMAYDFADNEMKMRLDRLVSAELDKIRQWDDAVEAIGDVAASEVFPAIYEKVKKGYSLSDAFYLANADRLQQAAVTRAEEAARAQLQSKEHLRGRTTGRGSGDIRIPADVMAEFKRIMPDADIETIRKFYQKDRAKMKK